LYIYSIFSSDLLVESQLLQAGLFSILGIILIFWKTHWMVKEISRCSNGNFSKRAHCCDCTCKCKSKPDKGIVINSRCINYSIQDSIPSGPVSMQRKDTAWLITPHYSFSVNGEEIVPGWAQFNQMISETSSPLTTAGYMPIIPSPVTEYNTVWTIIH
jgi:hypothetical protein